MKKSRLLALLVLFLISGVSFGQNLNKKFKMEGVNPQSIAVNKTYSESVEIFPFDKNGKRIYGLDASANIELKGEKALVRLLLIDNNFNEYLIYESYNLLLEEETSFSIENICEETSILDNVLPYSIQIEIENATLELLSLSYSTAIEQGKNIATIKKDKKKAQNEEKINKINKNLKKQGKHWVAGPTSVSELNYSNKKKLYGQSTFPPGFEFYAGGVISTESATTSSATLKSATASPYVDEWDWRDRHGRNWISPVTNQSSCGSCWAFASTGATEAMVNVFYNQQINLDLSEQDILSCSGAGSCSGGYPKYALDYISSTGVVDEATFPYAKADLPCEEKGTAPSNLIKISGRIDFNEWTSTEDDLKRMLIEMGPLSGGLADWSHAMVLVGYKIVKENDTFYYRDLSLARYWKTIEAGDPLIGTIVWIFKNSWGPYFGDAGYVYVETPLTNFHWTHAIKTPITSQIQDYEVVCEDRDGDGYYWWGLGEKPASCPECPDLADGNDLDASLGPLDEYGHCIPLNGTPVLVADFSANKTDINKGESVTFSDLTTNTPTSWNWTFEGGTPATSAAQNPSVTYSTAGTYKVTLTATNADGSDTKMVTNYIQVTEPVVAPVANFSGTPRSLESGETVSFSDLSTNSPTSWAWTFEGGTPGTSTAQNPTVAYHTSGNHQVTLVATNAGGSHTKVIANYIEVTEPVAIAVAEFLADTRSVNEGETVTFTDLSSNANEWNWTFEGGTPGTSTAQNPTVTYNTAGTYKVTLTAANGDNSDTKTEYNYIQVSEPVTVVVPVASFSADKTTVNTGESVSFSDLSSDATSWSWTFDGGTPGTSTAQNPMVSYSTAGAYKVTLTASNADGSNTKIADNYIQVNVPAVAPLADFSADNTSVTEGQDVTFSDKSVNNPVAWNWNFEGGEPATSTLKNPKIKYNSANNFKVSLTVTNEAGSDTKIVDNFVQVEQYVPSYCTASGSSDSDWIAGVEIDGQTKTSGYNAYSDFTSFGFDLESGNNQNIVLTPGFSPRSKFEYWAVWIDFNQDLAFSDSEKVFSSSKSKSAVSGTIYIPAGMNITTRMRVVMSPTAPTTACGVLTGGEVEDYTVRLFEPAPEASFTASSTTVAVGQTVQFTNTSKYNPTSLQWYFEGGDITESNNSNPIVTYNTPGSYDVTLIVSGDLGTSQKSMTITVSDQVDNTPVYCTPENISSIRNYIKRVVFDGLDFQSGGSGYQLPEATIDNLTGGQVYLADLYPYSNTTRNCWRIWIDFNKDGDFNDTDETVLVQNGIKGMVSANVAIPAYASGTTRMRISMKVSKAPLPCENDFIGEVEDYFVTFEAPSAKASAPNPSLDMEPQNTITVYPNPTSNFININIGNIEFDDSYTVYDLSGKMMLQNQITSSLTKVDLSTFAPGVYLVRVKNNQQIHTKKIIKKD